MSRFPALRRCVQALLPSLLLLSLGSCGQVGPLYLSMPDMPEPNLPPYDFEDPKHIFLPYGVTLPAAVGAEVPPAASTHAAVPAATHVVPAAATTHAAAPAATHAAPAAATHPAPSASTHR
jgi:predicted small lipoprotein YifL